MLFTDWINIDGSVYKFVTQPQMNLYNAEEYCNDLNGHLVRMETQAEFDLIITLLRENPGEYMHCGVKKKIPLTFVPLYNRFNPACGHISKL